MATTELSLEWLNTADGHKIPLRIWPCDNPKAIIHISHGMSEHSGAYHDVAAYFNRAGYRVYAHDHRCHGIAAAAGEIGNITELQHWQGILNDMPLVNAFIREKNPGLPVILLGHSMGSFIAQHFAQNFPDTINMLILSGSSFQNKQQMQASHYFAKFEAWRQGPNGRSKLIHKLSFGGFNKAFKNTKTDFDWLSTDPRFVQEYIKDPLRGTQMSNQFWSDFLSFLATLYQPNNMQKIRSELPIYLVSGHDDPVGFFGKGVKKLADLYKKAVKSPDLTLHLYPLLRHAILHEKNQSDVLDTILAWTKRRLGAGFDLSTSTLKKED